ncbi:MAG: NAD(P)-dependent oxidoreductase [Pseudomonadota bacterium]
MSRPVLILDQHFRRVDELFTAAAYARLGKLCTIVGGEDRPMPREILLEHLPEADFLIAAKPTLSSGDIACAKKLKAVIEVAGAFHDGLDYQACFNRDIEVLSSVPGFRFAVAEMAFAMILAGARGLVREHEAFRRGAEAWLVEHEQTDFTLYGQSIGFVGYGQIARECHRLLAPFAPKVRAYDPWLDPASVEKQDVTLDDLDAVLECSRVLVIAASPTAENHHLIDAAKIELLPNAALVILISRAHVTEFRALVQAAERGRIRLATDVFDQEPLAPSDPLRQAQNVILSPHRAAAVKGGRQPIGDMVVHDINAILRGDPSRQLKTADPRHVADLVKGQDLMA